MTITSSRPATPDSYVPSRRTVLRAAAWTAPAVSVAVAVPAYAAASSPVACADASYQVRWASHYNAQSGPAVAGLVSAAGAGTVGSAALTLSVTSRFFGDMEAGSSATADGTYSNLARLARATVGGTTMRGLTIMQRAKPGVTSFSGTRSSHRQELTLVFNRPVSNLKFKLTDIDSMDPPAGQRPVPGPHLGVSGAPSGTRAGGLSGAGTSGRPVAADGEQHRVRPGQRRPGQRGRQLREPAGQRRLHDHLLERPDRHARVARPAGRLPHRPDLHRVVLRLTYASDGCCLHFPLSAAGSRQVS